MSYKLNTIAQAMLVIVGRLTQRYEAIKLVLLLFDISLCYWPPASPVVSFCEHSQIPRKRLFSRLSLLLARHLFTLLALYGYDYDFGAVCNT